MSEVSERPEQTINRYLDEHLSDVSKFVRDQQRKPEVDLSDPGIAKQSRIDSLNSFVSYVAHKKDE